MNLNIADIAVIVILIILLFITAKAVSTNKKAGRNSCGCSCCSSCSGCKHANPCDEALGRDESSVDSFTDK